MQLKKIITRYWVSLLLLPMTPFMSYAITASIMKSSNAQLSPSTIESQLIKKFSALEKQYGGRIGISFINLRDNSTIYYRENERFPFASTFKVMAVAAILKKSESDTRLLNKKIAYTRQQVNNSGYAPITSKHIQTGMTVEALCAAALKYSDNTAVNLLIEQLGGPNKVTAFARSINDEYFNLTRWEPKLNLVYPGESHDTTTPQAMSLSLKKLVIGSALQKPQREKLKGWLIQNTTGDTKIRASAPTTWIVGDKTGSGSFGATNDIAVIWPSNSAPLILSIYYVQDHINAKHNNKVIREVTTDLLNAIK
ncbi:class A beta-lactamase [uncultured Shewanella sp.]|uniref:class A beta-lactamase n=1 Tax=uncultured Shewanella sp. TaxID=173975 RepID=UPI0026117708|nr:class A beta-lactamase [uncultured Shewanella sp.]